MLNFLFLVCVFSSGSAVYSQSASMPEEHQVLKLTAEMKAFLHSNVISKTQDPGKRLTLLIQAIFDENFLNLTYENVRTKTAAETFADRNGNCLSFTSMFVAMARAAGLDARFQEVTSIPTFDRRNNVVVTNRHMNALVTLRGSTMEVDFNPYQERRDNGTKVISDRRALGHFYSNLGAERFASGLFHESIMFFEKAVDLAPDLGFAWSNLGVAYRFNGRYDDAEDAYLKALRANRYEYTAMTNLAKLYDNQGREKEAKKYFKKAEHFRLLNPYYQASLGMDAFENGDYRTALKHYRKAILRKPSESEFYFGAARVHYQMGQTTRMMAYLKKAQDHAMSVGDRARYSQKLELLANK